MPQLETLCLPAGAGAPLCAAVLNNTTVDILSLQRAPEVEDDEADVGKLAVGRAQEADTAMTPKQVPLERYVGISDSISCVMLAEWDLFAGSFNNVAKWNVKVRTQARVVKTAGASISAATRMRPAVPGPPLTMPRAAAHCPHLAHRFRPHPRRTAH